MPTVGTVGRVPRYWYVGRWVPYLRYLPTELRVKSPGSELGPIIKAPLLGLGQLTGDQAWKKQLTDNYGWKDQLTSDHGGKDHLNGQHDQETGPVPAWLGHSESGKEKLNEL